jgi:hypothetical protein
LNFTEAEAKKKKTIMPHLPAASLQMKLEKKRKVMQQQLSYGAAEKF